MKHLGDITKINGAEIEAVDVITFGSPCQDLSVAGKRAGLKHSSLGDEETTRSGLFMEAIRIIKEMRKADEERLRRELGDDFNIQLVRPRYGVFENVPGCLSSGHPKGADFAAVIEEFTKIHNTKVQVDVPDKGWTNSGCLVAEDGQFSLAWRIHDARWWGVPQRRRRICVLCDFSGCSAPDILFG